MGPLTTLVYGPPPWHGRTETPRDIDALVLLPMVIVMIGTPILSAAVMALMHYPIVGAWFAWMYSITGWGWIGRHAPAAAPHALSIITWSFVIPAAFLLPLGVWLGWVAGVPQPLSRQIDGRRIVPVGMLAHQEQESVRQSGTGIALGAYRLSMDRETRHLGVVGATGSGKTTVIRTIIDQALRRGDKLLILDVKPELTALIPGKPILLAPWDKRSARWDIAADCRTPADAAQLAAALVGKGEGANAVFRDAARQVFTGLIVAGQKERPGQWDWAWLLAQLERMGADSGAGLAEMILDSYPRARAAMAEGKTRASVLMDLAAHVVELVGQLADAWPSVEDDNLSKGVSLRSYLTYRSKSQVIRPILVQQDGRFKHLSQMLATAVFGLVAQTVLSPEVDEVPPDGGVYRQRTWLILDEVAQLADLRAARALAEVGRSKGVRLVVGAQNWHQVIELAGEHAAKALSAQIGTWLIGRQGDAEAEKWASGMAGTARFQRQQWSTSSSGKGITSTIIEEERPLVRPERFGALKGNAKAGAQVLLRPGDNLAWIHVPHLPRTKHRRNHVSAPWILPAEPSKALTTPPNSPLALAPEHELKDPVVPREEKETPPRPQALNAEEIDAPYSVSLADDDAESDDEQFIPEPEPEPETTDAPGASIGKIAPTDLRARLTAAKAKARAEKQSDDTNKGDITA